MKKKCVFFYSLLALGCASSSSPAVLSDVEEVTTDIADDDASDALTSVDSGPDASDVADVPDVPDGPPVHPCAACLEDEFCDTYSSMNPDCGFEVLDGVCRKRPTTCAGEPTAVVCACDNVVYLNDCEANLAGVSSAPPGRHEGCAGQPTRAPCRPWTVACVSTDYCQTPSGFVGQGTCAPRPASCVGVAIEPVCGVSGTSYPSACEAAKAGEQLSADSISCQKSPCETNADCPEEAFCDLGQFCGATGYRICRPRPTSCGASTKFPACGCDGEDYASICDAELAGVTPKKDGLCSEGGPTCLGLEPDECGAGALCQFAIESQICPTGEIPELAGECVAIPDSCPEASADAAVCGCDGTTWPSLCHAHAAGVAAMRASPCE